MPIIKLTITLSVIVFTNMVFGESKSLSDYQPTLTETFQQLLSLADPEAGKALCLSVNAKPATTMKNQDNTIPVQTFGK